jgi:hypothetical protein
MKNTPIIAGFAVVLAIVAGTALASAAAVVQPATGVTIPWGDWIASFLVSMSSVFVTIFTWLLAHFAPTIIKSYITDEAVTNAVNYAIATVANVERGKATHIDVANEVAEAALAYIVKNEPKAAAYAKDQLSSLIVAKLSVAGVLPADATTKDFRVLNEKKKV